MCISEFAPFTIQLLHGGRASWASAATADIDFAIRVSPGHFSELIAKRFKTPDAGSGKKMPRAIQSGKILAGEAGLRGLRMQLERDLGRGVDLSIIQRGGDFDGGFEIRVPKMSDLFCKIFVLAPCDRETLAGYVASVLNGRRQSHSIHCCFGVVDVIRNDDADNSKMSGENGFLFFPYLIELEPEEAFDRRQFVGTVGSLLEALWERYYSAVAACDFEIELPRSGGQ